MSAIMQIMTVNVGTQVYLVVGNADGTIRFYDTDFKVLAWFEDQNLAKIKSISFSNTQPRAAT